VVYTNFSSKLEKQLTVPAVANHRLANVVNFGVFSQLQLFLAAYQTCAALIRGGPERP